MDTKKIPTKKNRDNFLVDEMNDDYLSTILTKKNKFVCARKNKARFRFFCILFRKNTGFFMLSLQPPANSPTACCRFANCMRAGFVIHSARKAILHPLINRSLVYDSLLPEIDVQLNNADTYIIWVLFFLISFHFACTFW